MARRFPPEFLDSPEPPAAPAWQPGAPRAFTASVQCAWDGLRYAFATQQNLRLQLGLAAAALFIGWLLRLPAHELALVFALSVFVIYAELVNTAIEHSVNHHAGLAYDPSVKLIKDMAAGSVLIVAFAATMLGAAMMLPHLAPLVRSIGVSAPGRIVLATFLFIASAAAWVWRCRTICPAGVLRPARSAFDHRLAGVVALAVLGTFLASLV